MEATINAVGQILLQALPTFFLVLVLYFFLRATFFGPFEKMLEARNEATEGARKQAAASLDRAAEKAAAYEESIRAARSQIYKEQEEMQKRWDEEEAARVQEARRQAAELVREGKALLAAETESAKRSLEQSSSDLATQIANSVLRGSLV